MPSPSSTLTTLRPELGTFYELAYADAERDFIGPRVLPVMTVPKQTGKFGKIPVEELLRHTGDGKRASGSGAWRDIMQFTDDSYATEEYTFEELIDDREAAMYSDYFDAETVATQRAVNKILTRQEMRVAALFDSTAYTNASMVQTKSNGTWVAGNPVTDVEGAVQKVYDATGVWPNAIIMNRKVFRQTRLNAQVTAAIESAGAGSQRRASDVTVDQLSAVFDLPYVLVAGGSKNTAGPGVAASIAQIWPNHVIVARIAETNDMREPCVGRQFHWAEDGSAFSGRVETYRDEPVRADVVRVRQDVDEKQLYLQMACMILSAI